MRKNFKSSGMSLIELMISLAILGIMITIIATFAKNIFGYNKGFANTLSVYDNSRTILHPISSEIRSASPSALGSYPIATADNTTFTFYADTNNDGVPERVRYYLSGTTLVKGTLAPSGNPLAYTGQETTKNIVNNIRNTSQQPIFSYYDANYTGSESSLAQPVDISTVRLVKITLLLDADLNNPPDAVTITTQVSLRNLKDNQ